MVDQAWYVTGSKNRIPIKVIDQGDGTYALATEDSSGGGAASLADGADVTQGAIADAAVAAGATGTISAKLRRMTSQLEALLTGIILGAGENHIGQVGGQFSMVSTSFTRPSDTTPYAAKDVIGPTGAAANLTFTNVARVNAGSGYIVKARMMTNLSTWTGRIRLHLFHTAPTAIADNAPYTLLFANAGNRVGYIDFPAATTEGSGSDSAYSSDFIGRIPFVCAAATRNLIGIAECLDVATPASAQQFFFELTSDVN